MRDTTNLFGKVLIEIHFPQNWPNQWIVAFDS